MLCVLLRVTTTLRVFLFKKASEGVSYSSTGSGLLSGINKDTRPQTLISQMVMGMILVSPNPLRGDPTSPNPEGADSVSLDPLRPYSVAPQTEGVGED